MVQLRETKQEPPRCEGVVPLGGRREAPQGGLIIGMYRVMVRVRMVK